MRTTTTENLSQKWALSEIGLDQRTYLRRYYKWYVENSKPIENQYLQLLHHSNGIFLIRINPENPKIKKSNSINLNFQVTANLNRLENKISGKRKRNAQWLDKSSTLCFMKLNFEKSDVEENVKEEGEEKDDDFEIIKLQSPVRGKLLQINEIYNDSNRDCDQDFKDLLLKDDGFIAIVMPNKKSDEDVLQDLCEV